MEKVSQVNIKNVPVDVLEKLKMIADINHASYTEVYNVAFTTYIKLYEKKRGVLPNLPAKGKGLENLI